MSKANGTTHPAAQREELHPFGINYRWTDGDGVRCSGHTVEFGRDRAHAERRFFKQHRDTEQPSEEAQ